MTVGRGTSPTATKSPDRDAYKSFSSKQNMLAAHQRLPIHMEYLQPHITSSETKASPLALLAATCSSIGKTDAEKMKDQKTTTTAPIILSKLSPSQEVKKSSFKPYKFEDSYRLPVQSRSPTAKTTIMRSSPPVLVSNSNIVSSKISSSISNQETRNIPAREKTTIVSSAKDCDDYAKYQERLAKELKESYKCRTNISPPLPHMQPKVSMLPHSHAHHSEYGQCKPGQPQSDMIPGIPRPRNRTCSCSMCNTPNRNDGKCQYPPHPAGIPGMYHPAHKPSLPLPPPPVAPCRDPNCTGCSKGAKTIPNYIHPALAHCSHGSAPIKAPYIPPPPPPNPSSYDPYYHKNGPPMKSSKPHVCNWVADGKHCGGSFSTSEELYQHLRTHTSLQRNSENAGTISPPHSISIATQPSQGGCNLPGCPCGQRKASPRTHGGIPGYTYSSGMRYSPFGRQENGHGHSFPPPPPHSIYPY